MFDDTKVKSWVAGHVKPAMFMGQLTPTEINQKLFSNGDTATVCGIPYDTENNHPGVATIGGNELEVRNGDVVMCETADIFVLIQESPEEENMGRFCGRRARQLYPPAVPSAGHYQ